MLERIMNSDAIFWTMGVIAGAGIICKIITVFTLKRLVRAAGKMGKSNQKLMKLVKAKFEHAFMLSDRVDNVDAFVEKYLFEYRVFGLRLHTYQYFSKQSVWLLGFVGLLGMFLSYGQVGMEEETFQYGTIGGAAMVLLFLVRISSDEAHQLDIVKTYMIDYLENVCAPRYSKQQSLKHQRMEHVMNETVLEPAGDVFMESEDVVMESDKAEMETDEREKEAVRSEKSLNPDMKEIKIPGQKEEKVKLERYETAKPEQTDTENMKSKTIETKLQNMENDWRKEDTIGTEDEKKMIMVEADEKERIVEENHAVRGVEPINIQKREPEAETERRIPQEVILREILEEFLA